MTKYIFIAIFILFSTISFGGTVPQKKSVVNAETRAQLINIKNKLDADSTRIKNVEVFSQKYSTQYMKSVEGRKFFRAILKVESDDGRLLIGEKDPSFGSGQLKVSAARDAAAYWGITVPSTEEKLIWKLLLDQEFNIKIAAAYYGMLLDRFKDPKIAVIAYNRGPNKIKDLLKRKKSLPKDYLTKVLNKVVK